MVPIVYLVVCLFIASRSRSKSTTWSEFEEVSFVVGDAVIPTLSILWNSYRIYYESYCLTAMHTSLVFDREEISLYI